MGNMSTIVNCVLVGLLLRWSVALFPYSGEGQSPKFGDYEAHRHWMEITNTDNLTIQEWYVHTPPANDLQYWGLDYPPLSALHSFIFGKYLFKPVLPKSIELLTSHGYESTEHKFWMRLSVVLSDLLLPSLILFHVLFERSCRSGGGGGVGGATDKKPAFWLILFLAACTPPFILIDYGHFQYNCVSLGLTVLAVMAVLQEQMSLTSILFTLAVNHKQMSLYHAIPFALQMIGSTIFRKRDILTGFRICSTIVSTMALLWMPYGQENWLHIISRIFPLKRGVFEDKVGTFWYALDRVTPFKGLLPAAQLAKICGVTSVLMLFPSAAHLFWQAKRKRGTDEARAKTFLLSLLNISLIFFLFSYHVHEKSIMLPLLPATLLLAWFPIPMIWFTAVSTLSLYPLLYEEKSHVALFITLAVFILTAAGGGIFKEAPERTKLTFLGSITGYMLLIAGHLTLAPPTRFPHLFQAAIAIYSFLHYALFSIYFHFMQFELLEGEAEEEEEKDNLGKIEEEEEEEDEDTEDEEEKEEDEKGTKVTKGKATTSTAEAKKQSKKKK